MANWTITSPPAAGYPPITAFSAVSTPAVPIGTIVTATDSTTSTTTGAQGSGEFIYLAGVASTVAGSLVTYNPATGVTVLAPTTANKTTPFAVAMSANILATTYGWYQISGVAAIAKTTIKVNPAVAIYVTGSGQITSTAASGKQVTNAVSANATTIASATGTVLVTINRPGGWGSAT